MQTFKVGDIVWYTEYDEEPIMVTIVECDEGDSLPYRVGFKHNGDPDYDEWAYASEISEATEEEAFLWKLST